MDRTRLLEKIKKCLAMANDGRGNSEEAAVALGQAQKLMAKHGVTDAELGAVGYGNEAVRCPIQVNKKLPMVLNALVHLIKEVFGVDPTIETEVRVSDESYVIRYFGPEDRVLLATYSHTVVYRAMERAWREQLQEHPYLRGERGARTSFQYGWLNAVRSQVEALAVTEADAAQTKLVKTNFYGKELAKVKANNLKLGDEYWDGADKGAEFKLHRPMTAEKLKLGGQ